MNLTLKVFYQILTVLNSPFQVNQLPLQHSNLVVAVADSFNVLIVLKSKVI